MSYSHNKVCCKNLAKFIITVFAKSIACDLWSIVKFLRFPVFANCWCVVSSVIMPTLASNYHRRQCVVLQWSPDPVSIWFSGKIKLKIPWKSNLLRPTIIFFMCPLSLLIFFILGICSHCACFKFKVLDKIPVLLNLVGNEIMCFFKYEKCFIEKRRDEPSPA